MPVVRTLACLWALLVTVWSAPPAMASQGQILISYDTPANAAHAPLRAALIERRVLETARDLLEPFRLPKPLTLRTAGCDGATDAWFEGDVVTVCYEYIAWVVETARSAKRPAWVSERDALIGPMLDVFLHEAGHAVFDYLDVPLFGREEDAADQFSAYLILQLGREKAPGFVAGIAALYLDEAGLNSMRALKRRKLGLARAEAQADPHSTPVQRLYNVLCLAYGAAPAALADAARLGVLPTERAEGCAEEFAQVDKAFRRLILPHIDPALARERWAAGADALARAPRP